ncbi:MAG: hypothetical protein E6H81_06320 [Chloroflexi bacterium]|nr:MAG: hypothetical protein E6H81_06320 [Chloroflexota bacterium]
MRKEETSRVEPDRLATVGLRHRPGVPAVATLETDKIDVVKNGGSGRIATWDADQTRVGGAAALRVVLLQDRDSVVEVVDVHPDVSSRDQHADLACREVDGSRLEGPIGLPEAGDECAFVRRRLDHLAAGDGAALRRRRAIRHAHHERPVG